MAPWRPVALPARYVAARRTPIVGRHHEREVMERVWERVGQGEEQVLLLGGEPGAGKTRLAVEAACVLHGLGAAVLAGGATRDAGTPYQPFVEMLDHLFLDSAPGSLDDLIGDAAPRLRRLSRHVDLHVPAGAVVASDDRHELFDAVGGLFRRMAAGRSLVLVVDDLHWAQLPALALLDHVVRACLDTPTLVVATVRTTAPEHTEELSVRLADLYRMDCVHRLDLGGLDTDAIAEFVCQHGVPTAESRVPAALLRDRTGGNPFFLRETWADLARLGGVAALRRPQRVPRSIGDTLAARLAGLGAPAREIVELAAVLGETFDVPTLVRAGGADASTTMDAVDAARAVGLVDAVDEVPGRHVFVHALTRQAVLDRLPQARRTALHAQVAEALAAQSDPALIPRIAHHYLAAHPLGHEDQARHYAVAAARQAEQGFAFEVAAAWFDRAAALPDTAEDVRCALSFDAATNHLRAGDFATARQVYEGLTGATDPLVRLQAAIGLEEAGTRLGLAGSRSADLLTTALEECALAGDDLRRVRGLAGLGRALASAGRITQAREVGERAIGLARQTGDPATLRHAIATSLWHGVTPDLAAGQLARTGELVELCAAAGDRETRSMASLFRAMAGYLLGRPEDLAEAIVETRRDAEGTRQPWADYFAGCLHQGRAFLDGDFALATRRAQQCAQLGAAFDDGTADGAYGVQMFMIHRETGRLEQARAHVTGREGLDGRWVPGLLALYTELGLTDAARTTLHRLLDRGLADNVTNANWPIELTFMAEAALALGDADAAAVLRPMLAPFAGMNLGGGQLVAVFGSTERLVARMDALRGDLDSAEHHFVAALAMDRRMGSAVHTAETLAEHALALHAAGTDPARARDLAAQARDLAEPRGHARVLRRLDHARRGTGPADLTPREVEVIALLAEGLSNRDIAARLVISTNTAANHVRSILIKTGAANRTQAARYATEHRLA